MPLHLPSRCHHGAARDAPPHTYRSHARPGRRVCERRRPSDQCSSAIASQAASMAGLHRGDWPPMLTLPVVHRTPNPLCRCIWPRSGRPLPLHTSKALHTYAHSHVCLSSSWPPAPAEGHRPPPTACCAVGLGLGRARIAAVPVAKLARLHPPCSACLFGARARPQPPPRALRPRLQPATPKTVGWTGCLFFLLLFCYAILCCAMLYLLLDCSDIPLSPATPRLVALPFPLLFIIVMQSRSLP